MEVTKFNYIIISEYFDILEYNINYFNLYSNRLWFFKILIMLFKHKILLFKI